MSLSHPALRRILASSFAIALLSAAPAAAADAVNDTGSTDEDTVLTVVDPGATASLFANDTPIGSNFIGADSTSTNGASVTVNADGTFSYDPTSAPALQALPQGTPLVDTFTYTITDSVGVANGRYVRVQNNGTASRRMDIGEVEVFAPGVTPAVDNAGGSGALNPSTDLATLANGASVHSQTTNQPHGFNNTTIINGTENTGAIWSTNGVANFVIIDLGSSMDVETVRVHQRNDGCCQDRLRDFTVSLLADGGGNPGAVVASGVVSTQPPNNRFGEVSLMVIGATDAATVSVTVNGVNDAPVANSATYVVQEDGPALSSQAMTGSDVDTGDALTFITTTLPAMGMLTDNNNGTFTFDPNGEFESLYQGEQALISFDFEVEDALGLTDTGTITIIVQGINDDPTPMPDAETTDEDTLLSVLAASGLLSNDGDTDGDAVEVQSIDSTATLGTVVADLTSLKLGSGLSGAFYDFNGATPPGFTLNNNNGTGNQTALLLPLPDPGDFVLQRLGLAPSATVITPRVDFGTGTNVTQGDGSVLNRGGFGSGTVPPWQGLFNDVGETADMDGDQIAGVWAGKIQITTPGAYTFTTRSDDGTVLFVDGVQVVDNNRFQGMTNRFGTVNLSAGLHDISIGGYEGGGGAGMQASYEGPDTAGRVIIPPSVLFNDVATPGTFVSGGLRGDYYDTNNAGTNGLTFGFNVDEFLFFPAPPEIDLAIQALFPAASDVRSPRIDFGNDTTVLPGDGGNPERGAFPGNIYGGIGVVLDGDQVGGVWTGSLWVPETADFRIWQRVDDGGTVLIDVDGNGSVHDPGDFAIGQGNVDGTISNLSAGPHKIVIASREGGGNHRMVVSWQQLTGANPFPREVIPTQNLITPGAPMVGDGSFTYDPNGNFESLNVGDTATTTFTYTVVDPYGNAATETVTITIKGVNDPPTVTGRGIPDQTIFTSSPSLDVPLFDAFEDVDNSDNELTYTVTLISDGALIQTSVISSADGILTVDTPCTLAGTADITVEARDPGGLSVTDTFRVEVKDDVPPVIAGAKDAVFSTPVGGRANASAHFAGITATDKVDGIIPHTCSLAGGDPLPAGNLFEVGVHPIECTAQDAAGNSTTVTFNIVVLAIQTSPGERMFDVVSLRGDPAIGAGVPAGATVFNVSRAYLNNSNEILYAATLGGAGINNVAVFKGTLAAQAAIATKGMNSGVGPYGFFSQLTLNDVGDAAFQSQLGVNPGQFVDLGGGATVAAIKGGGAPTGGGEVYVTLQKPALSSGGELLTPANLLLGSGLGVTVQDDTLITSSSGAVIAREGSPSSIAATRYGQLHPRVVASEDNDHFAYSSFLIENGGFDPSDNTALFAGVLGGAAPALVVRENDPAPAVANATISQFLGESINSSGDLAIRCNLIGTGINSGNNEVLYTNTDGPLALVAREGDVAPCLPNELVAFGRFSKFYMGDDGSVCFHAFLKDATAVPAVSTATDGSLWRWKDGQLHLIAREGDLANNTDSAIIRGIVSFACSGTGGIAYSVTYLPGLGDTDTSNNIGVYLDKGAADLVPELILRRGDSFDLDGINRIVVGITLSTEENPGGGTGGYGRTINDAGSVLLNLTLSGNKSGLFVLAP